MKDCPRANHERAAWPWDRARAVALALVLLASAGCLFNKSDHIPGLMPPGERVELIREKGEHVQDMTPAERRRIMQQLATEYTRQPDPLIRRAAIVSLGEFPTSDVERILVRALKDEDKWVRVSACEQLGRRGRRAVAPLAQALADDPDHDVRVAAAKALGRTRSADAVAPLGRALQEKNPALQYVAMESLERCTGEDLGRDVERWRRFVEGKDPGPPRDVSVAERIRQIF